MLALGNLAGGDPRAITQSVLPILILVFVTRPAASAHLDHDRVTAIPMSRLATWKVRLELLHRRSDRSDPVVQVLTNAAPLA